MAQGFYSWSKTAATNANADASINWAEGQAPSSVNDSARALMARAAEYRDDVAGSITTTGTATAYVAATNQAFESLALMDKQAFTIIPHATSGASPTLAVDGLTAKPLRCATGAALSAGAFTQGTPYRVTYYNAANEFIADGAGIADGAISTANLAALAVTAAKIANNTITATQLGAGSVGAAAVASSFVPVSTVMLNGTIVCTQAANAMTFAIKTLAGVDASASDPITFLFRHVTGAVGTYLVRTVTAALSITVPASQAIGFVNAVPGRMWILAIDNAGTVELAVFNAGSFTAGTPVAVNNIYFLHGWGIIITLAIAAAPNAGVGYSTTARSGVPYVPIGYASWEAGNTLATAGTWNVLPSRLQIFQPGSVPLPGSIVQQAYVSTGAMATGSTVIPNDDTIPQITEGDPYINLTFLPSSSANPLLISVVGHFAVSASAGRIIAALFQDATANAFAVTEVQAGSTGVLTRAAIDFQMLASILSLTTFRFRAGQSAAGTTTFNGEAGARLFGGVLNSGMRVTEIMA